MTASNFESSQPLRSYGVCGRMVWCVVVTILFRLGQQRTNESVHHTVLQCTAVCRHASLQRGRLGLSFNFNVRYDTDLRYPSGYCLHPEHPSEISTPSSDVHLGYRHPSEISICNFYVGDQIRMSHPSGILDLPGIPDSSGMLIWDMDIHSGCGRPPEIWKSI